VVGNSFGLGFCHRALGRQQVPGGWPIQTARQRDRLRKACSTTIANHLSGTIRGSHASNHRGLGFHPLALEVSANLVNKPMTDGTDTARDDGQWKVVAGVWTSKGRIYVPAINSLCGKVLNLFHDIPESGHFVALKTTELVLRDIYWPVLDSRVRKYVRGCVVCH
jgi:hypothetical protein